ncbi:hypothetical protein ACEPAH_5304 [Sanghuangporus vaninii]
MHSRIHLVYKATNKTWLSNICAILLSSAPSAQNLIVGSGPAGLILALTLLKNGVTVRNVEKNTEYLSSERRTAVMPRTLEVEHFYFLESMIMSNAPILGYQFFTFLSPDMCIAERVNNGFQTLPMCIPQPMARDLILASRIHSISRGNSHFLSKKQASPILLNSYESERMLVIVEIFNMMAELFNKLAAWMEQRGLETTEVQTEATEKDKDKETFSRGWKHHQPDVNYRWSEIVFDERFTKDGGNAKDNIDAYSNAGCWRSCVRLKLLALRLWDESLDYSVRLSDVFKSYIHTILVFRLSTSDPSGSSVDALLAPVSRIEKDFCSRGSHLSVRDGNLGLEKLAPECRVCISGRWGSWYGLDTTAEQITIVMVYPDGMIGAFARSSNGVQKDLSHVFD